MAYPILSVANRILELAKQRGKQVDPMKLQKMVYLAHGWHLLFFNKPLVTDAFEVWPYGPVNPELYRAYKKFGAGWITSESCAPLEEFSDRAEHVMNEIIRVYGDRSAMNLSSLTHEPCSAWANAKAQYPGYRPIIPDAMIRAEFEQRQAEGRA